MKSVKFFLKAFVEFPNGIYSYELNGETLEITSYHMMDITTVEN